MARCDLVWLDRMVDRRRCFSVTKNFCFVFTASIGRSSTLITGPLLNSGQLVPKDGEKSKIVLKNRSIKRNQSGDSESRHDVMRSLGQTKCFSFKNSDIVLSLIFQGYLASKKLHNC